MQSALEKVKATVVTITETRSLPSKSSKTVSSRRSVDKDSSDKKTKNSGEKKTTSSTKPSSTKAKIQKVAADDKNKHSKKAMISIQEKSSQPHDKSSDKRSRSKSPKSYSRKSHNSSVYKSSYVKKYYSKYHYSKAKTSRKEREKSRSPLSSRSRSSLGSKKGRYERSRSRSNSLENRSRSDKSRSNKLKHRSYRSRSRSSDKSDSSVERRPRSYKAYSSRGLKKPFKKKTDSKSGYSKSPGRRSRSQERKRPRARRSRSLSSSSSPESRKNSSRSRYSQRSRKKSKSYDSSSSSCSSSSSSRSSSSSSSRSRDSRSNSPSPKSRRHQKRNRSGSSKEVRRVEPGRLMRHLSPPPFPRENYSIYCINSPTDKKRLAMRPLSPVSADIVTSTVENAWNFYFNRYYGHTDLSDDIVYDSQIVFLKSYSGLFTQVPNFENCYTTLYKPEDLKAALRLRLDRLSPGPPSMSSTANAVVNYQAKGSYQKSQSGGSRSNTARSMETLIRTGAVPGLSVSNLGGSTTTSSVNNSPPIVSGDPENADGIRGALRALRQSYSKSDSPKSPDQSSQSLYESNVSTESDSIFLLSTNKSSDSQTEIPFLNDGTVTKISPVTRPSTVKKDKCSGADELPWHYRQPSSVGSGSPRDVFDDEVTADKHHVKQDPVEAPRSEQSFSRDHYEVYSDVSTEGSSGKLVTLIQNHTHINTLSACLGLKVVDDLLLPLKMLSKNFCRQNLKTRV